MRVQNLVTAQDAPNLLPSLKELVAAGLIASLDPERPRKVRTAEVFEPTLSVVELSIVTVFMRQQQRLVELMHARAGLDAARIIITSPIAQELKSGGIACDGEKSTNSMHLMSTMCQPAGCTVPTAVVTDTTAERTKETHQWFANFC